MNSCIFLPLLGSITDTLIDILPGFEGQELERQGSGKFWGTLGMPFLLLSLLVLSCGIFERLRCELCSCSCGGDSGNGGGGC